MLTAGAKRFCQGAGSTLILSPALQKRSFIRRYPVRHSDAEAIHGDWEKVGQDLQRAVNQEKQNAAN